MRGPDRLFPAAASRNGPPAPSVGADRQAALRFAGTAVHAFGILFVILHNLVPECGAFIKYLKGVACHHCWTYNI